ncbi:MAG: glycosyltransferase family 1 protein [Patescibacteria group bacterium]
MSQKVYVFDPTSSDKQSAVRGIGRYLQILKENFSDEFEFVSQIDNWKLKIENSVFINPFFNFLQPPVRSNNDWTLHRRIAKKQIAIIHDLIPLKYPSHFPAGIKGSIYILLNKLALKNYDLIVTDSEASKKDIINILRLPEDKIRVVYPCLPQSFLRLKIKNLNIVSSFPRRRESKRSWIPSYEGMTTTPYCLYVGDATWNKNLVNLAKTIKIANVNCVFVGKIFENCKLKIENFDHPWQSELKEFFKLTKDDKRFIFAGFVPDSELIKLYERASFNILPSRDEGFGFSWLESANFFCPSLLSDIPVLREISNGKAIFFDQNNPQNIADKIKEIILNKDLRSKIGVDAKKRSEFFSREKFKREVLNVI